jgi:hypothetical protein
MIGENIALIPPISLTVAIQRCRTAARASVTELTHLALACQQSALGGASRWPWTALHAAGRPIGVAALCPS